MVGMSKVIRTDKWHLAASKDVMQAMSDTRDKYRDLVRFLITVVNTHYVEIAASKDQLQAVERLIHDTKTNPSPKYSKFFGKDSRFYKFPSYLRRAAIHDALGQVFSFHTRYRDWQGGNRKRRDAKPPRLNINCNVHPDLYYGQCIKFDKTYRTAQIKVFKDNDWKWVSVSITSKRQRHLLPNAVMLSPTLVVKGGKAHLSIPVKIKVQAAKPSEKVCAVDIGINTTAVCSIVDFNGVVHDRLFIHDGKSVDKRDKHLVAVSRKASLTMGKGGKLHKGFAATRYRKAAGINRNMSLHTAKQIFEFAQKNGATTIVFEDLKGWKPKGGKKRSTLKQRFHGWMKSAIADRVCDLAEEYGILVQFVYARGTSSFAYDGSGQVKRDSKNYALATFTTGKRYNCDLSACYNIAARHIAFKLKLAYRNGSQLPSSQSSRGKRRMPVTLSQLWDREATTTALCA